MDSMSVKPDIAKGDVVDLEDVYNLLRENGYRNVNLVQFPRDFTVTEFGGHFQLDVFLAQNKSTAVRLVIKKGSGVVDDIQSFDVATGQVNLSLHSTVLTSAVEEPSKGNVVYYIGTKSSGIHFCTLRGAGLNDAGVREQVKKAGFAFKERQGLRRLMAWYAVISQPDLTDLLNRVQEQGFSVVPSDKLKAKFRIVLNPPGKSLFAQPHIQSAKRAENPFTAARSRRTAK
jgi:transcription-repair coupling factor (superfamily II helicase)